MSGSEQESQGPVIRDRRRIDPVTGQPRQPAKDAEQPKDAQAGQAPRGPGQPRPGKHAVSKPGTSRQDSSAGSAPSAGQAGQAPEAGDAGPAPADTAPANTAPANTAPANTASASTAPPTDTTEQADRRQPGTDQSPPAGSGGGSQRNGGPDVAATLAERTADLQRLQAEYANYRKRVERDRAAVRDYALANVVSELLPVLDDIGRAREHEELTGGFKAVAESLQSAATKLGLTTFGEVGEPFDPNVHEALMHSYSPDVTEPTCVQILQPGYKVGERILRPARVAVAEPSDPAGARTDSAAGEASSGELPGEGESDEGSSGENSPDAAEAE